MKIEFKTKNYSDNNRIVRIIENKLSVLDKFVSDDANAIVMLKSFGKAGEQYKFTLEISLQSKGQVIRAEATSYNMWDNIDRVIPKLEAQLSKLRKRKGEHVAKSSVCLADDNYGEKFDEEKQSHKIVKVKNYDISIITPKQAIDEMEQLDHSFYVFLNADDNKVSVIYRRMDGNYGLISPEY